MTRLLVITENKHQDFYGFRTIEELNALALIILREMWNTRSVKTHTFISTPPGTQEELRSLVTLRNKPEGQDNLAALNQRIYELGVLILEGRFARLWDDVTRADITPEEIDDLAAREVSLHTDGKYKDAGYYLLLNRVWTGQNRSVQVKELRTVHGVASHSDLWRA